MRLSRNNWLHAGFLLALTCISVIVYRDWFSFNGNITYSDLYFRTNEVLTAMHTGFETWIADTDLGFQNIQLYLYINRLVWWILAQFSLFFDVSLRITHLLPTAVLSFIAPYLLFYHFTKKHSVAFVVSLFYGSTTYILFTIAVGHAGIFTVYALAPLVFLLFKKALDKNTVIYWLLFALLYSFGISYEFRIMFLLSCILLGYFGMFYYKRVNEFFIPLVVTGILVIFLNLFWILPTMLSSYSVGLQSTMGRGTWGEYLFNIHTSFTLFEPLWNGSSLNTLKFELHTIPSYFWIIPFVAFLPLFVVRKHKLMRLYFFFMIITIIGIFLGKQSAIPFQKFYLWAYITFPFFSMFRTAARLYLLIAFGYAGMLAIGLTMLTEIRISKTRISLFAISSLLIIFVAIANLKPVITQEIGALFVNRSIPREYDTVNALLTKDRAFYRTLTYPEGLNWLFYAPYRPKTSWFNVLYPRVHKQCDDLTTCQYADNLLDMYGIRYIVVEDNEKYPPMPASQSAYLTQRKLPNTNLTVYENKGYLPRIYVTNKPIDSTKKFEYTKLSYTDETPTRYTTKIPAHSKTMYLYFSDSYHPDWKLKIDGEDYVRLEHNKTDAELNEWKIPPINKDRTVTLYFAPQVWMNRGLFISTVTLIGILFTLCVLLIWKIKR